MYHALTCDNTYKVLNQQKLLKVSLKTILLTVHSCLNASVAPTTLEPRILEWFPLLGGLVRMAWWACSLAEPTLLLEKM